MFNALILLAFLCREQPPPRGCVLKQRDMGQYATGLNAAASARLCVETTLDGLVGLSPIAAASARLCVETKSPHKAVKKGRQPPPRGCVLKRSARFSLAGDIPAAASARLCVETSLSSISSIC